MYYNKMTMLLNCEPFTEECDVSLLCHECLDLPRSPQGSRRFAVDTKEGANFGTSIEISSSGKVHSSIALWDWGGGGGGGGGGGRRGRKEEEGGGGGRKEGEEEGRKEEEGEKGGYEPWAAYLALSLHTHVLVDTDRGQYSDPSLRLQGAQSTL